MSDHSITVVMATAGAAERGAEIERALASLRAQRGVRVQPLVIVNGKRFSPPLLARLRADRELRVEYVERGSYSGSLRVGRSLVGTEFFAFLDDDDELLPDTLALRLGPLVRNPALAAVIANGVRTGVGRNDQPAMQMPADPAEAQTRILAQNWLASCGGLYRAAAVTLDYFDGTTDFFEWTLVAVKLLIAGLPMEFLDIPVFRIHETAVSLSRSAAYEAAGCVFLEALQKLALTEPMRRLVRRRLAASYNTRSVVHLRKGEMREAWRWHLRSLASPGGWRFLPYTLRVSGRSAADALGVRAGS